MSAPDESTPGLGELLPVTRPQTLSAQAAEAVRAAIVSGALPAGSNLTVPFVAQRCGVSATPAREALIRLEEVGLVKFNGRKITIVSPTVELLRDAFEVREALEGMAARLAARRRSDSQAVEIRKLAEKSVEAAESGAAGEFLGIDRQLHGLIAQASGSPQLVRYHGNALDLVNALRNRGRVAHHADVAPIHVVISRAISEHDEDEAERRMREHIRKVYEQFVSKNFSAVSEAPSSKGSRG